MSVARIASRIEQQIRLAFRERGWGRFWPTQFVEAGIGDEKLVLEGLTELVRQEKLLPWAHIGTWAGVPTPEVLARRPWVGFDPAGDRDDDDDEPDEVEIEFLLRDEWRRDLEEELPKI